MKQKRMDLHRAQRGQGFVEYAMILVLVAVVVVVAAFATGLAVQRVYGIVVGVLGVKHDATSNETIAIDSGSGLGCWVISAAKAPPTGQTGLYVPFNTNITDLSLLTGSTNLAVGGPINPTAGGAVYQPLLASFPDAGLCPKAAVIQSKNGAIATVPIEIKYLN